MPHHRVPVGPSRPHQPIMSLSSSSLSLSLSHPCPCPCPCPCHRCHLRTPHPPCEQLLAAAERGAGSSWHVGAISVSSVPIASSSHSVRAGAHSGSGGCCPVIPVVRRLVPVCLCSASVSPHSSLSPFHRPSLSAASTRDPPCEQWLAGLGAGAGSFPVVGLVAPHSTPQAVARGG
jgi:hypothetical protein